MAAATEVRIEIGLEGGQGVELTADSSEWQALEKALDHRDPEWVSVKGRDGAEYRIATGKVGYVRVITLDKHVGFGG